MSMPRSRPVTPWYRLRSPEVQRYLDYVSFAKNSAINLKPNYLKAVDEYNRGVPLSEPWFNRLFYAFNAYFQQGQAAPGRLTPALGAAALKQWSVDEAPSSRDESISNAIQVAAVGIGLFVVGGAVYGAMSGPSESASFTAANSTEGTVAAGAGEATGETVAQSSLASQFSSAISTIKGYAAAAEGYASTAKTAYGAYQAYKTIKSAKQAQAQAAQKAALAQQQDAALKDALARKAAAQAALDKQQQAGTPSTALKLIIAAVPFSLLFL